MADATVPKGEEVFDGSDAAGEVGGADADAFRVGNPYPIDNDHRKAGVRYFLNSVIVTIGAVVPLVLFSFMASYAIVRGDSRLLRFSRTLFLLGLAIPLQATIIPIYLIITRIQMYDSLGALILPSIAFGIPLTVLILCNFIRDVPRELFESMRLDGCTDWQMAWRLAFPLTRRRSLRQYL